MMWAVLRRRKCLHLSRYPKHAALIGAALYFVKQFLDQV